MLPGVRTYATLVAGAAGVDLRRFLTGALPALIVWLVALVTVGAVAGVPAEHVVGKVDGLIVSGALLVVLGVGAFLAISRVPRAPRGSHPLTGMPEAGRLCLAAAVDLGIVAASIAGIERLVARVVNPGHPFGRVNDTLIVTIVGVVAYILAARRIGGATLGESLFGADYRTGAADLAGRVRGRRRRPRPSGARAPAHRRSRRTGSVR
jgi:hypothetical protein